MQETSVQSLGWEDPLEEARQPTPVFLPGEPHGQRRQAGYGPWGHRESDRTERLSSVHENFTYDDRTQALWSPCDPIVLKKLFQLTSSPVETSPGTTVTLLPILTKGNWTRGRPQTQAVADGDKPIIPLKTWAS